MKKIIYSIITFSLIFFSSVFAMDYNSTCNDTNTLIQETKIKHYIDDILDSTEVWNQTIICNFGCLNGRCLDPPGDHVGSYFMTSIGLIFMAITFIILGLHTSQTEGYGMLQFMFITLGLIFGVFNLWFGSKLAENLEVIISGSSISSVLVISYFVAMISGIMYMFYGVIKWFIAMFDEMKERKAGNRDDE